MKKKIISILLTLVLVLVLGSCHRGSNKLASLNLPDEFDETKTYNISFWAKNDGNTEQVKVYNDAIAKFESIYPNINVEIRHFSSYPEIYRDVLVNIATETTPNVCIAYPDHVATYKEGNNIVVNLTPLLDHPSYGLGGEDIKYDSVKKEEIYEKFLSEGIIDDLYYTLPFMRSSEAVYINKDYVEALGFQIPDILTWEWLWEVCEQALIRKGDGTLPFQKTTDVLYPMIYKSTDNMYITMCKQMGIPISTIDSEILLFSEETKELLLDLGSKGRYEITNATTNETKYESLFTTFTKVSYPGNFFNRWECLFAIDSTAGATWLGTKATSSDAASGADKSKPDFETVVRPVPQLDVNNPQMISQGPSICLFNKQDPQEVVASWIFAQFLLTEEIQLGYTKTEGYLPVTTKATESANFKSYLNDENEYNVKRDATKLALNNIDYTFISPVFNGSSDVRDAGAYLVEGVCGNNKRYKTAEEIDSLYQKCIEKYGLQELINATTGNVEKRKISKEAIILLVTLGVTWLGLGSYVIYDKFVKKKRNN